MKLGIDSSILAPIETIVDRRWRDKQDALLSDSNDHTVQFNNTVQFDVSMRYFLEINASAIQCTIGEFTGRLPGIHLDIHVHSGWRKTPKWHRPAEVYYKHVKLYAIHMHPPAISS